MTRRAYVEGFIADCQRIVEVNVEPNAASTHVLAEALRKNATPETRLVTVTEHGKPLNAPGAPFWRLIVGPMTSADTLRRASDELGGWTRQADCIYLEAADTIKRSMQALVLWNIIAGPQTRWIVGGFRTEAYLSTIWAFAAGHKWIYESVFTDQPVLGILHK